MRTPIAATLVRRDGANARRILFEMEFNRESAIVKHGGGFSLKNRYSWDSNTFRYKALWSYEKLASHDILFSQMVLSARTRSCPGHLAAKRFRFWRTLVFAHSGRTIEDMLGNPRRIQ